MLSNLLDRLSFVSLFLVVVLLPIFFLPLTKISVETSKGFLLVVGLVLAIIFWTMARFSDGKITVPKSWVIYSGLGMVIVFLISAFFSSAQQVSFFGTMFDIGSFWSMASFFVLMLASSILIKSNEKAGRVLFGLILSSAIILIFQTLHLFYPNVLSLGVLGSKTDSIVGSWNVFGLFAGFFSVISIFIIEFFPISKLKKIILGILIFVSVFLIAAVNSSLVWAMLGFFSLLIFIYKVALSFNENKESGLSINFPIMSFIFILIPLLFFMSGQFIGGYIPNRLNLTNVEISPSFTATMSVTKAALMKNPVLGIGPNRFGDIWSMYKPIGINSTPFWDTRFDFGSGLLPTLAATTGILGILSLLAFLFVYLLTGVTSVLLAFKNAGNQMVPIYFLMSLYLMVAAFFYPVGMVLFALAFACIGVFVGLFNSSISGGEKTIAFSGSPKKSMISLLILVAVMVTSFVFAFKYVERLASVSYFSKALNADTIDTATVGIGNANLLYQNDLYLRSYSQVYLLKLNSLISKGSALTDDEKASLQQNLDEALRGANSAIAFNTGNYQNYTMSGSVFNMLASLGVEGSSDKAIEAYKQASLLNPLNPGIQLALARTSFTNGKVKEAKDYANAAIALKADYVDAYIVLSQIAKSEGNGASALSYAEKALSFSPTDKDLIKYVSSLKGGATTTETTTSKTTTSKDKKTQ